jgi:hypothetical protein
MANADRPGYERNGVRIVKEWEYSCEVYTTAESVLRHANTSEWELVSVTNDPHGREWLVAFYRRRTH